MADYTLLNTPRRRLPLSVCVLGLSLALGSPIASAGEAIETPTQLSSETLHEQAAPLSAGAAGMQAHIDPDTGEFKNPPLGSPSLKLPPTQAKTFSTSAYGLSQRPSPTPGGGMMVDLKNRFLSPLTATLSPHGKLTIRHLPPQTPASSEKE